MASSGPSRGPFQLLEKVPSYHPAQQMCLVHNMLIRAMNAIYVQATSVSSPKDISDFLVYCQCWYELIHHHHALEEEFFFPEVEKALEKPGLMSQEVAQHDAFHDKLDAWAKKCYEFTSDTSKYDGNEWRKMIDEFSVPLVKHLHDEIGSLQALEPLDTENVITTRIWKELDKKSQEVADLSRVFPMALSASDATFLEGKYPFPKVPFFVPYMVDWYYARKHRGAWRFAPSDMHGRPRSSQCV